MRLALITPTRAVDLERFMLFGWLPMRRGAPATRSEMDRRGRRSDRDDPQ